MKQARRWFYGLLVLDLIYVALFVRVVINMMHRLMVGGPDQTFSGKYLQVILAVGGITLAITLAIAMVGHVLIARGRQRAGLIMTIIPAGVISAWFLYAGKG